MSSRYSPPQVLLLAAGFARRFGADKTCQRLADGLPLVMATLKPILPLFPDVLVVLRSEQHALRALLAEQGVRSIQSERAAQGMGGSLSDGVRASAAASGWVVALADMPLIQPETYWAVSAAIAQGGASQICAPVYQGQRGHPVGFGVGWGPVLQQLDGDVGARHLFAGADVWTPLPCDDPGVVFDIDYPEQLAQLNRA